ncbi:hypothetical protein F4808DRAFT_335584 [Astrocystis sublimbata]|nr:hypothetical protein F4808DRAFT_335584 [Astrocystis sublimbata]
MASNIPIANAHDVSDKSRNRRMGTLLNLSKGKPSLAMSHQHNMHSTQPNYQSRTQTSRIPQSPSTRSIPSSADASVPRPLFVHENLSRSTHSLAESHMAKLSTQAGGHPEPLKRQRNVLRRKQTTMLRQAPTQPSPHHRRNASSSSNTSIQSRLEDFASTPERSMTHSPEENYTTRFVEAHRPIAQPNHIYPELDRYRDISVPSPVESFGRDILYRLATEDLPPPTPLFSGGSSHSQLSIFSASPSTRFSGSPGTGPYSRDTTPTSTCSQSPSLIIPMRLPATRTRQASPAETRPPITRRRTGSVSNEVGPFGADPQGLAAVTEALTSSSSSSTVRTAENKNSKAGRGGTTPAPPNPPPRKSSQKFKKNRDTNEDQSPSKASRLPSGPLMGSPSPAKLTKSPRIGAPVTALSPQRRPTPPSRPSRDGTPDLHTHFGGPVPIIQSNLATSNLTERRRSGQLQPSSLPKLTTQLSNQDKVGSSRPSFSRENTSDSRTSDATVSHIGKQDSGKQIKTPSPSVSTFRSKFSLFTRRTKVAPEGNQTEKTKDKTTRKGPAAGTGHEGYGRVGAVRRRGSTTSTMHRGLPGYISSSESLASNLSSDPFLLERMSPVIIAGGEVVENRNSGFGLLRTDSNQSTLSGQSSPGFRKLSNASQSTSEVNRQTLWPSPHLSQAVRPRRPSDDSDLEEEGRTKPTLAYRRASRLLQTQNNAPLVLPRTLDTRAPSVASMATTIHTDESEADTEPELNRARVLSRVNAPAKKLTKRSVSPSKWTFFGRSQVKLSSEKPRESVTAIVQPSQNKPPAFYTIMDSPEQASANTKYDIASIFREAEVFRTAEVQVSPDRRPSANINSGQGSHSHDQLDTGIQTQSPSEAIPPIWQLDMNQERNQVLSKSTELPKSRPSRLPQVGRIPKVISGHTKQPSSRSFSRPFNQPSVQTSPVQLVQPDQAFIAKGPTPPDSVTPSTSLDQLPEAPPAQVDPSNTPTPLESSLNLAQHSREFLSFPIRQSAGSGESFASSCSDILECVTAVTQAPGTMAPLQEDEVWDEYDDLLEDSLSSPTSSCGAPFELETYQSKLVKELAKPLESPTITTDSVQDPRVSVATMETVTTSSHQSVEMTARINAAFRFDSIPPVTPFSVSEFVSESRDCDDANVEIIQEVDECPEMRPPSLGSGTVKAYSNRSSQNSKRTSGSSGLSEVTPLSQVNIRVGSMTVSKWLTFGHVLFSPVRDDLINEDSSLKRQSILVIDGLGNDDWSFYAAETYPAANFFNLSPRPPVPKDHPNKTSFPLSPSNHHQIQFTSHADKFPFGPDSFTALVFRFPSAAPEAHYRNLISEAERVLKPGGYIEFAVLDVDLNNVGGRTRRAVRQLKEHINDQNPDVNLSSTADILLRLLGKKGFVDVKTCSVGVPVASSVTNRSSKTAKKDERSLAEMMNDKTELGDESITKMVSKVGRWWYNRCYEVPTGMSRSIWHDRALLNECEEWGTSLKLMVCHARIPEARGRLASI